MDLNDREMDVDNVDHYTEKQPLITQAKLYDLVRDLDQSKHKVQLLDSMQLRCKHPVAVSDHFLPLVC
jgi:hypothetical protein